MTSIIERNQLLQKDGIYMLSEEQADFAYSDGQESEQYLEQVFSRVDDLSSASPELQQKIIDWPSEYHFTHKRANLLRGLDLNRCSKVLELGSGCGAISRYLGEQGLTVDAIEGSAVRARLGRQRCRDLPNVRVINANYNELEIPQSEYDLVVFVGVIEYASMFYPEAESDYAAARKILTQARSWLAPGGVALVAIENRLGLKYILGQHEDHYHKRYIGIDGYRQSVGMATYSRQQWHKLLKDAGFSQHKLLLPFPDYKVPEVVLSEDYVNHNACAFNHLEGVFARDYSGVTERLVTEPIAIQAATHGGFLAEIANSFCLLLGDDNNAINQIANLDFYHGPVLSRKAQYIVDTRKPSDTNKVIKRHLFDAQDVQDAQSGITQQTQMQEFYQGDLLSTCWLRTILVYNDLQPLNQHLQNYFQFLNTQQSNNTLAIDVLPNNIIVDSQENWRIFDQEWQLSEMPSSDYVYFRALLNFITRNWYMIREFLAIYQFNTVKDFIRHGFAVNALILDDHIDDYVVKEQQFQSLIGHQSDIQELLLQSLEHKRSAFANATIRLCGDDTQSVELKQQYQPLPKASVLSFNLSNQSLVLNALEFMPYDLNHMGDLGFFQIEKIKLSQSSGTQQVLWQIDGQSLALKAEAENLVYNQESQFWSAQNVYPRLQLDISDAGLKLECAQEYVIEVTLLHYPSDYYSAARSQFIAQNKTLRIDNDALRRQIKDEARLREEQRQMYEAEIARKDELLKKIRDNFVIKVVRKTGRKLGLMK